MIDDLLDELFDTLFSGSGAAIQSRMVLRPDPGATSYFIPARTPRMSADDLAAIETNGLMAEMTRLLDDAPEPQRTEVLGKLAALVEALAAARADLGEAEPPSLIYALH